MVPKVILSAESLSTHITGVRSFIRVGPFVYKQVVGLCKLTVTEFAHKLFLRPAGSYQGTLQKAVVHLRR